MAFTKIFGISGRRKLKKTSPYASLCLEIASSLTRNEFSDLRLVVNLDKLVVRKKLCTAENASDLLGQLNDVGIISKTDTHFLEDVLLQIGRKDLVQKIVKYHEKRTQNENTPPSEENTEVKTVADQSFTQLKVLLPVSDSTSSTVMKEVHPCYTSPVTQLSVSRQDDQCSGGLPLQPGQFTFAARSKQATACKRLSTDCSSEAATPAKKDQKDYTSPPPQKSSPNSSLQEDGWSQMSVDSSQKSAMSISDDEKIGILNDKLWLNDTDDVVMASL